MQTRNEFGVTVPNRNSLTAEITVPKRGCKKGAGNKENTQQKKQVSGEKKN